LPASMAHFEVEPAAHGCAPEPTPPLGGETTLRVKRMLTLSVHRKLV
jgi:hypothetical protein